MTLVTNGAEANWKVGAHFLKARPSKWEGAQWSRMLRRAHAFTLLCLRLVYRWLQWKKIPTEIIRILQHCLIVLLRTPTY